MCGSRNIVIQLNISCKKTFCEHNHWSVCISTFYDTVHLWHPIVTFSLGWWASVEVLTYSKTFDSEMAGTSRTFMTTSDSIATLFIIYTLTFQPRLSDHTFWSSCSIPCNTFSHQQFGHPVPRHKSGVVVIHRTRHTTRVKGHLVWFPDSQRERDYTSPHGWGWTAAGNAHYWTNGGVWRARYS